MGRYDNAKRDQYTSTPRKVFDKEIDRQNARLSRHKEDHRADVNALLQKISSLQTQLTVLADHVNQHCDQMKDLLPDHEDDKDA